MQSRIVKLLSSPKTVSRIGLAAGTVVGLGSGTYDYVSKEINTGATYLYTRADGSQYWHTNTGGTKWDIIIPTLVCGTIGFFGCKLAAKALSRAAGSTANEVKGSIVNITTKL